MTLQHLSKGTSILERRLGMEKGCRGPQKQAEGKIGTKLG